MPTSRNPFALTAVPITSVDVPSLSLMADDDQTEALKRELELTIKIQQATIIKEIAGQSLLQSSTIYMNQTFADLAVHDEAIISAIHSPRARQRVEQFIEQSEIQTGETMLMIHKLAGQRVAAEVARDLRPSTVLPPRKRGWFRD